MFLEGLRHPRPLSAKRGDVAGVTCVKNQHESGLVQEHTNCETPGSRQGPLSVCASCSYLQLAGRCRALLTVTVLKLDE